jgi:RNA polymerase sigma-70 factor (ECF subfamily)
MGGAVETAGELFERHRAALSAAAYRMLGNRADADDVLQEAWLR